MALRRLYVVARSAPIKEATQVSRAFFALSTQLDFHARGGGYSQGNNGGAINPGMNPPGGFYQGGGGFNQGGGGFNQGGGGFNQGGGGFNQGGGGFPGAGGIDGGFQGSVDGGAYQGSYNEGFGGQSGGGFNPGFGGGGRGRGGGRSRGRGNNRDVMQAQQMVADSMGGSFFEGVGEEEGMESAPVIAEKLNSLKKVAKTSKSRKERIQAVIDGKKALMRCRIDPNSDEKTVLSILNSGAFFHIPYFIRSVENSYQWVCNNAYALSPRNLANACYAIGAIKFHNREETMLKIMAPIISKSIDEMQPVELAMTLQALGRVGLGAKVDNVAEAIVRKLMEQGAELHPSCVASTLEGMSLLKQANRNSELMKEVYDKIVVTQGEKINELHSDLVNGFAHALAGIEVPPPNDIKLWSDILERLSSVAHAVQPKAVASIFDTLAVAKSNPVFPIGAVKDKVEGLLKALDDRVAVIPTFFGVDDMAEMSEALCKLQHQFPKETLLKVVLGIQQVLVFNMRVPIADLADCAEGMIKAKMGHPLLFTEFLHFSVGVHSPRPPREGDPAPINVAVNYSSLQIPLTDEGRLAAARNLSYLVRIRLAVEATLGPAAAKNPCLQRLYSSIISAFNEATSDQKLLTFRALCTSPAGPNRNTQFDNQLFQLLGTSIRAQGPQFNAALSASVFAEVSRSVKGRTAFNPMAKQIAQVLEIPA